MLAFSRPRALFAFGNLYRRVWVYFWFSQSSAQVLHFRAPWINGASLHWSMSTTLMSIEQLEGQSINQSRRILYLSLGETVSLSLCLIWCYTLTSVYSKMIWLDLGALGPMVEVTVNFHLSDSYDHFKPKSCRLCTSPVLPDWTCPTQAHWFCWCSNFIGVPPVYSCRNCANVPTYDNTTPKTMRMTIKQLNAVERVNLKTIQEVLVCIYCVIE